MKFNTTSKNKSRIKNHEGANAFALSPQMELYTAVATTGLSDQFYEKSTDKLTRLRKLIEKNDPSFTAKLAVYVREKMNLRSVPLVLTVELAKITQGTDTVSKLTNRVVQRADEITELLAYYSQANNRTHTKRLNKLSKQLQKGLAAAFNKFDEYQFAKYNRDTEVKLRDALFLVHPKAKDEAQQVLFDKIVKEELQVPYTWEVELSVLGQQKFSSDHAKKEAVKAKWEELILSNKLGYMATLRNLRNILEAKVSNEALNKICRYLGDTKAVANSKQLPFRYLSAYRELKQFKDGRVGLILEALEKAVLLSAQNIAGYDADTAVVIAADVSGSMQRPVSAKSKVMSYDIGLMLAMLLQSRCDNVITGMFGDRWKAIAVPKSSILANVDAFYKREGEVGYSTNGHLVIEDLIQTGKVVDKVMFFTDCQLWNSNVNSNTSLASTWARYKKIAPHAKLYLFDLAGYGTTPLSVQRDDVYMIAGWSDKIFDVLQAVENGKSAISEIKAMAL